MVLNFCENYSLVMPISLYNWHLQQPKNFTNFQEIYLNIFGVNFDPNALYTLFSHNELYISLHCYYKHDITNRIVTLWS